MGLSVAPDCIAQPPLPGDGSGHAAILKNDFVAGVLQGQTERFYHSDNQM
jgi:hypothetical protein